MQSGGGKASSRHMLSGKAIRRKRDASKTKTPNHNLPYFSPETVISGEILRTYSELIHLIIVSFAPAPSST